MVNEPDAPSQGTLTQFIKRLLCLYISSSFHYFRGSFLSAVFWRRVFFPILKRAAQSRGDSSRVFALVVWRSCLIKYMYCSVEYPRSCDFSNYLPYRLWLTNFTVIGDVISAGHLLSLSYPKAYKSSRRETVNQSRYTNGPPTTTMTQYSNRIGLISRVLMGISLSFSQEANAHLPANYD